MSSGQISAVACAVLAVLVLAAGAAGVPGAVFLLGCAAYRWQDARPHRVPARGGTSRRHGAAQAHG